MQGINKEKHLHLVNALLQLKRLLDNGQADCSCSQQAEKLRKQVEAMYCNYERLLKELSEQIIAYEILYNEVKVAFLGKKLKELKKEITSEKPAFIMLQASIRLAYRT